VKTPDGCGSSAKTDVQLSVAGCHLNASISLDSSAGLFFQGFSNVPATLSTTVLGLASVFTFAAGIGELSARSSKPSSSVNRRCRLAGLAGVE